MFLPSFCGSSSLFFQVGHCLLLVLPPYAFLTGLDPSPTASPQPSVSLVAMQTQSRVPLRLQVDIAVTPGGHASEAAVNKQLNDKERVAAALENPNLLRMVDSCLAGGAA